jgi:hypothetical protein
MAAVQISRVDENTMQLIYPIFVFSWDRLVNKRLEVDIKWEFVTVIDLTDGELQST